MDILINKYYIQNGLEKKVADYIETKNRDNDPTIYEVIRVMDGIPLFIEQHLERLKQSALRLGYSLDSIIVEIQNHIMTLIKINEYPKKNIKLIIYNMNEPNPTYTLYFIESLYPSHTEYENGVHTVKYKAERSNPNVKVINNKFKNDVSNILEESKAYEAILISNEDCITEGSKSNIFLIKDNKIYTSPLKNVLPGVTRTNIIKLCKDLNITVKEEEINSKDLSSFDALFITGTSPKILPIATVDEIVFNSSKNPLLNRLTIEFDKYISHYIEEKKMKLE